MMTTSTILQHLITLQSLVFLTCIPFLCFCLDTDTISPGLQITDPDTIVSAGQAFKLGFFTPHNSDYRYLGILHISASEKTVWIANRNNPLNDSSGVAKISDDGNLILTDGQNQTLWSTNATISPPRNTTVQILDTGNLELRDNTTGALIWDSFSNPANVYVPTMRISEDVNTGKKVALSSWKTELDPAVGNFTAGMEALNLPQIYIWNNGRPHWRSGPWNGASLGIREMYSQYLSSATIVNDSAGLFYFIIPDRTFLAEVDLNSTGSLVQTLWNDERKTWDTVWFAPQGECDVYGACGAFGSCNADNSPICSCLRGFEPVNEEEWRRQDWRSGCRRVNELQCSANGGSSDRFLRKQFMKIPDFFEPKAPRVDDCESVCLRNCSCIAYVHDPYVGCMFFSERLIDVQEFNGFGYELYVRLSASDFGGGRDKKLLIIIIPVVCFVVLVVFIGGYWMIKRKGKQTNVKKNLQSVSRTSSSDSTAIIFKDESEKVNIKELPLLTFEMLANATDQFHDYNLLGKGGFGSVYRGNLGKGKEIAVKRLSAASGQGTEEFMNEVIVISKLQHRNLVRLLGCCVEKEEKMLVYEYMPNKSLDVHLFDPTLPSQKSLDWNRRFSIIEGIGRGLLYLHRDSRLRIIHRDLKPSNVLLDEEWEPKISDFGMARIFGGNEDYGNTARIVGTYGYMAPEYAMEGTFSEKSDVYSFGVLTLEIIKGQKNSQYYNHDWSLSLLGCAWKLWSEGKGLDFADEVIASPEFEAEIVRCIQIALLCVQEDPKSRPSIQTALSMLSHEIVDLPAPEQPIFAEKWNGLHNATTQIASQDGYSVNEISITVVDGR